MLATPIREAILEKVVERLQKIKKSSGYRSTPVRVLRKLVFLDEVNEFPVLVVLPRDDGTEKQYDEMGPDGVITGFIGIGITIMAEGTDQVLLSTLFENLLADIEVALCTTGPPTPMLDLHLDELVRDIKDTGRIISEYVATDIWLRGQVTALYHAWYEYNRGNP